MGILRTTLALTGWGSLATVGTFAFWTRQSRFVPMPPNDYIYNTTMFARFNPERNPTMSDLCVRRVPLGKIRPELLEDEGKLVERFCAGVWGSIGMFTRHHW